MEYQKFHNRYTFEAINTQRINSDLELVKRESFVISELVTSVWSFLKLGTIY